MREKPQDCRASGYVICIDTTGRKVDSVSVSTGKGSSQSRKNFTPAKDADSHSHRVFSLMNVLDVQVLNDESNERLNLAMALISLFPFSIRICKRRLALARNKSWVSCKLHDRIHMVSNIKDQSMRDGKSWIAVVRFGSLRKACSDTALSWTSQGLQSQCWVLR